MVYWLSTLITVLAIYIAISVAYKTSVKLSQINPKRTKLHSVIGGGHKNLNNFESYHQMIHDILNSKPQEIDLTTTSIHVKHSSKPSKA